MGENAMRISTAGLLGILVLAVGSTSPAYGNAPSGRYTVSNGTVYDTKTKLTWQQSISATQYSWADAKTYCTGVGSSLGGIGWHLPTVKDLLTIVDRSQSNPAIDSVAFPSTPASRFWSMTSLASGSGYAWYVNFADGYAGSWNPSANPLPLYYVRCVR
jgi:hypothetical protein